MKQNKRKQFIAILILSGLFLVELVSYLQNKRTISTFKGYPTSETETKDQLIIALFMDNIASDSGKFYHTYFQDELAYYNYEYDIKNIKKDGEPTSITITFEGMPVVGPHISVGEDEITYKVDAFGNKTLEQFVHKKSYEIPEREGIRMIRPYPEKKNTD